MSRVPSLSSPFLIGFDQIGERVTLAVDFLIVLVAFARQNDHVIRRRASDQLRNRLTTAGDEGDVIHSGETGADVIENHRRVFRAWIVIGDQYTVGQAYNVARVEDHRLLATVIS